MKIYKRHFKTFKNRKKSHFYRIINIRPKANQNFYAVGFQNQAPFAVSQLRQNAVSQKGACIEIFCKADDTEALGLPFDADRED